MVDEAQIPEPLEDTSVRDGLEIGVYLSIVLAALIIGFEDSLDEGGELLLIWGTSIGLTLAHILAFRTATVYEHGISLTSGWRPVRAMTLVAVAVAALASIPYLEVWGLSNPSVAARWVLTVVVAVAAYLAARSRGLSMAGRLQYLLIVVLLATSISVVKYMLAH